jgi:large subunit ribosomal protein L35
MATKAKVHSGASKRFKKTGAGYKFKHANKSHILTKIVDAADVPRVKRLFRAI